MLCCLIRWLLVNQVQVPRSNVHAQSQIQIQTGHLISAESSPSTIDQVLQLIAGPLTSKKQ